MEKTTDYMARALKAAGSAAAENEVPVGAIVVDGETGEILAEAGNETEKSRDPTAHAEMVVLRTAAGMREGGRLDGCDLYVTLEPCPMCAAAISLARIRRVYFGAYDPKSGGVEHGPKIFSHAACHHKPEVYGGMNEEACGKILKDFFKEKREK